MPNYYYDLPTEIIDIINNEVKEGHRKEHAKLMEDTFDTIQQGRLDAYMKMDEAQRTTINELWDEYEEAFEQRDDGETPNDFIWRWYTAGWTLEGQNDMLEGEDILEAAEHELGIKYRDQMNNQNDIPEFIILIKALIKDQDIIKKREYDKEKEYLLYLIRQKEEAADKGYLLNDEIINYMDMPVPDFEDTDWYESLLAKN